MTPRRLRPPWPGLERRREADAARATVRSQMLNLFRTLSDAEGHLDSAEWVVREHVGRVTASLEGFVEALQGTAERPERGDQRGADS